MYFHQTVRHWYKIYYWLKIIYNRVNEWKRRKVMQHPSEYFYFYFQKLHPTAQIALKPVVTVYLKSRQPYLKSVKCPVHHSLCRAFMENPFKEPVHPNKIPFQEGKFDSIMYWVLSMRTVMGIHVVGSEANWQSWWAQRGHDWGDTEHGLGQTAECKLALWEMESSGIRAAASSASLMTCHRGTKGREKKSERDRINDT